MFLELKKAFDTVHHELLLHRLARVGIRGTDLFKTYLCDRTQEVNIGDASRPLWNIQFDVPQCVVLGPVMFPLCINGSLRLNVAN